jgi:GntR family transcriptional repressor for pyruvate dehydrogenase complex
MFEKIIKEPAYRQVSSAIEGQIMSRNLKPGDTLPSELDLADQFGLNRSTIREGLRQLEMGGLVERRTGSKRLFVKRPRTEDMAAGISKAMALHDVTFQDVWEAMMILEPQAAEIAATRATEEQLRTLEESIDKLRQDIDDKEAIVEGAVRFFNLLAESTGNHVLTLNQEPLSLLLRPSLGSMIKRVKQAGPRILEAQEIILGHLKSRNSDQARDWMRKHILDFKRGYALSGIEMNHLVLE